MLAEWEMLKNTLKNREDYSSRLGLGTLRFSVNGSGNGMDPLREEACAIVRSAYEQGIRYIDCAPTYCGGQCEQIVGEAIMDIREDVLLASKIPLNVLQEKIDLRTYLAQTLKRLGTDHLDYYYFWAVKKEVFDTVALQRKFLEELWHVKQEGLVKKIGFSFHDKPEYAIWIMDQASESGCPFDAMLCQYNLLDRRMEQSIAYAKEKNMEVMVMGAAAGGKLAYEPAYRFVLQNPNVDYMLIGVSTQVMLVQDILLERETAVADAGTGLAEIERERYRKQALKKLYCSSCGYCMPCQAGVQIPGLMSVWQKYLLTHDLRVLQEQYQALAQDYGDPWELCTRCGLCEKKCPQGIRITKWINRWKHFK